jgi:hypothetical protein
LRLILLVVFSLAVVFACFLPYVMHYLGSTAPWRMASAFILPFPISVLLYQVWLDRWGTPDEYRPGGYSRIATWLLFTTLIASSALLSAATFGYAGPRGFGFYLSAVLITLFQASLVFVRLLITSFRSSEPAA